MYKSEMIIEKLGGKPYIAEKIGVSRGAAYLWFYGKPKGCEGKIPPRSAIKILKIAKEKGVECTLEDLVGG